MNRINFCGVIEGSVTKRKGESETEAIQRAEMTLNDLMDKHAKRFGRLRDIHRSLGPIVGLEPHDNL